MFTTVWLEFVGEVKYAEHRRRKRGGARGHVPPQTLALGGGGGGHRESPTSLETQILST